MQIDLEQEINSKIDKISDIFKEEIANLHYKIIDGSPVDYGSFKTSWQLLDFNPKKLKFTLYNPKKYGMKLWRYKFSKQGWSPSTGDALLTDTIQKMHKRFNEL